MKKFSREIQKRDNCVLHIDVEVISGYSYIDIRQYYRDKTNEFIPSQKGVTLNTSMLDEFIDDLLELKHFMVQNME
ncbi:transcriptional coactivator p15/PC4 family protein [Candidatus Latescibacterota bacterium]